MMQRLILRFLTSWHLLCIGPTKRPMPIHWSIMFLKSRRAVWTRPKSSMYDNNYSKTFARTSEATMTFREEETVIADGVSFVFVRLFYVHAEEQFDGSLWSRPDPFLEGSCGRSGWPRKNLIRVRQQGFSRILTSGIRNELSKRLKLNTCKGESEQPKEETRRTLKEKEERALGLRRPLEDFCVR